MAAISFLGVVSGVVFLGSRTVGTGGLSRAAAGVVVEARDLSVYDTVFGTSPLTSPIADGEVG